MTLASLPVAELAAPLAPQESAPWRRWWVRLIHDTLTDLDAHIPEDNWIGTFARAEALFLLIQSANGWGPNATEQNIQETQPWWIEGLRRLGAHPMVRKVYTPLMERNPNWDLEPMDSGAKLCMLALSLNRSQTLFTPNASQREELRLSSALWDRVLAQAESESLFLTLRAPTAQTDKDDAKRV